MIFIQNRQLIFLLSTLLPVLKAQEATCGQNRCVQLFDPDNLLDWQNNFDPFVCGNQCDQPCGADIQGCLLGGGGNGGCDAGQFCVTFATHTIAAQLANYDYDSIDPCPCDFDLPVDCFSSMATADVENKGKTPVKDIQVGDKVLTGSNGYRTVYTIDHKNPGKETNFIQIYSTQNDDSPLEITKSHMVFIHGTKSPIPASAVKVGDLMLMANGSSSNVTKISSITREGVWNPITTDGTIVVDGFVTSTYNSVFKANGSNDNANVAEVTVGGFNLLSHHEFVHLLMAPYRSMCLGLSLSFCESKHEFNAYSSLGNFILKFYRRQSQAVQDAMVIGSLVTFKAFHLLMHPLVVIGAILGAIVIGKKGKKQKNIC